MALMTNVCYYEGYKGISKKVSKTFI